MQQQLINLSGYLVCYKHQEHLIVTFHMSWYLTGTLGYVMSEVEDGKPFSQVVNAAKSLGYTEPGDKL